ncbi:MAG: fibronectin type III domain-containing protein [Candidatus Neomarinimicrobiota bacterium]
MINITSRAALIVLLAAGCSDRERTNPLDPNNQLTKGAPVGLEVVTILDTAYVNWQPFDVENLTGYRIYRWTEGDTLAAHATISFQFSSFQEYNLISDQKYYYAVQAITETDESGISAPDSAIPGPNNFWVTDYDDAALKRVTYDGSHIISQVYVNSPFALVADPVRNRFWVADYWNRAITVFARDLSVVGSVTLEGSPFDLAISTGFRRVYCLQINPDAITILNLDGEQVDGLDIPGEPNRHSTIAMDEIAVQVWLGQPRSSGEAYLYRTDYRLKPIVWHTAASFGSLNTIKADPVNGGVWAATGAGMAYVGPRSEEPLVFASDVIVYDISFNPENGDCYFIGRQITDNVPVVGRITGDIGFRRVTLINLPDQGLVRLQVLAGAGPVGFLAWQDSENRLIRFTADGTPIGHLDGVAGVTGFALE